MDKKGGGERKAYTPDFQVCVHRAYFLARHEEQQLVWPAYLEDVLRSHPQGQVDDLYAYTEHCSKNGMDDQ